MNSVDTHIADLLDPLSFESAVGVVDADATLRVAYGDIDKVFALASVSKLISTYAALVAIDRGAISLGDWAGEGTPKECTVEHLLSHAAGFAFEGGDMLARPGVRRMYSNAGIEQLGRVVEAGVGMDFNDWVKQSVIEPLDMQSAEISGSPAKSYRASIDDLLHLGLEFMAPTLISAELAQTARKAHFPDLDGVVPGYGRQKPNPWGLGPEIKGHKSPHWTGSKNSPETFGHFGQAGSFLWVDPKANSGRGMCAAFLSSKPFSDEHAGVWPALNDLLLQA